MSDSIAIGLKLLSALPDHERFRPSLKEVDDLTASESQPVTHGCGVEVQSEGSKAPQRSTVTFNWSGQLKRQFIMCPDKFVSDKLYN